MKKILYSWIFILLSTWSASAQLADSIPKFAHNLQTYLYFRKDDFLFSPMYTGDKEKLHLEARYNYEDRKTFSGWTGYNFEGGKKLKYVITPMLGVILGNTKGIGLGIKLDLEYKNFAFISESEFVFDPQEQSNNFYYNWTDFTYSANDWLWFGLSIQRTKVFQTNLDIQRGIAIGSGYKWLDIMGYFYNPGTQNKYFVLAFSASFP